MTPLKVIGERWRMDKTGFVIAACVGLLVAAGVLLKILPKAPEKLPEPVTRTTAVTTAIVREGGADGVVTYAGTVAPVDDVSLAPEIGGTVAWIDIEKGHPVTNGQIIARLDDSVQGASLDRAAASLAQADDDLRRLEQLHKSGGASESDLQAARTRRDVLSSGVREASAYLGKCELRSPIDGRIEEKLKEVGEFAPPGVPILRIADTRKIKVAVHVPENNVGIVGPGQRVELTADALPGRMFEAKVVFVSAVADRKSNTFLVEAELQNEDMALKGGMVARVSFATRATARLSVPVRAIIPGRGEYIAFVAKDGNAVRRIVKLESLSGNRAVIKDGLAAGELVIVDGNRLVMDGGSIEDRGHVEE